MNLTTTEKYALAVLEARGRLSSLRRQEQALCLVASCIWDLIQAGSVAADEKGKLRVSAPLPESLSYCGPLYDMLEKKPMKPDRVVLTYIHTLTGKRIKGLVDLMADNLINKALLVTEQQISPRRGKLYHVNAAVIAEDIAAVKHTTAYKKEQLMLAVLLTESGAAKKLLDKKELRSLKKTLRQVNSDFRHFVRDVKRKILGAEIIIAAAIPVAAAHLLL